MIPFAGSYTQEQYFRGIRLALRPSRRDLLLRGLALALVLAIILLSLVAWLRGEELNPVRLLRNSLSAGFLLYWALANTVRSWLAARRSWRAASGRLSLQGAITEAGIRSNALAPNAVDPWERFLRADERDDIVVLLGDDGLATILPRSFFASESDWQGFLQMVRFKVTPPG